MGFFRRLFGTKNPSDGSGSKSNKRRWSFVKNIIRTNKSLTPPPPALPHFDSTTPLDASKHAIAVAAATAAVAEAALAAAHAAAEVVRLTGGGGGGSSTTSRPASEARVGHLRCLEENAAVKIQSAFRSYLKIFYRCYCLKRSKPWRIIKFGDSLSRMVLSWPVLSWFFHGQFFRNKQTARRALRALKALVKLQALVRGHIVRKQTADMLRRMQTLVRLQAQARASRAHLSDNTRSFKSSLSHYPVPEEYERPLCAYSTKLDGSSMLKRCSSNANFRNIDSERARFGSNWFNRWMEDNACSQTGDASLKNGHPDDEKSDKILEVDTWKPHFNSPHSSSSFQTAHYYMSSDYNNENFMARESPSKRSTKALNQNLSSREALQLKSLEFHKGKEEVISRTADNSPQAFSASSRTGNGARRGSFTPTRSECSWGYFSGYSGYPNYMANTESSRAKFRSQSAPKQRLEFQRYGSSRRHAQNLWDVGPNSDRDADSRSKVLPTSSRLNRIGSNNLR